MNAGLTLPFLFQLLTLTENDLAPNWYDVGASKSKKRKGSSSTHYHEKKKKAATIAIAEDETLGENVPLKR